MRAIDARVTRIVGGERRLAAFLAREFGVERLWRLDDGELERACQFVFSTPE